MNASKTVTGGCCFSTSAEVVADGGAIWRAIRSKVANSSGSGPRSVTSTLTRPVSSAMLRARTTTASLSICSDPTTTCDAPTSWPMRIMVASVSTDEGGTCSRSNACWRSVRVMAPAPSALRSSVSRTAAPSVSQKKRPSRVTFSNGMTRIRAAAA